MSSLPGVLAAAAVLLMAVWMAMPGPGAARSRAGLRAVPAAITSRRQPHEVRSH